MKISAKDVKALRDRTGAGMMDCKKALTEAEGDIEKAIEILRKKGQKLMGKRADRDATEGVVVAITNAEGTRGVAINLACETDFVAKNADFIALAEELAQFALENSPASKDELTAMQFNDEGTVAERTTKAAGVIGEKIEVKKFDKLEAAQVVAYIHAGYKVGVLVGLDKANEAKEEGKETLADAGKNLAMQIAALAPVAVDKDDIPQDVIEKEKALQMEITRKEKPNAPEKVIQGIVMGRINKALFKEKTLMNQDYVKGNKTSVKQYLASVDKKAKVTGFVRMDLV